MLSIEGVPSVITAYGPMPTLYQSGSTIGIETGTTNLAMEEMGIETIILLHYHKGQFGWDILNYGII